MRIINDFMNSKRFDDLLDKMNTCTIFLLVICSSFFLTCLHAETNYLDLSYNWLENPFKNFFKSDKQDDLDLDTLEEEKREEHAIVFDAGSTGTRIHIFTFSIETRKKLNGEKYPSITLKSEHFKSITPGLSSYAEDPSQAAESIKPLLEFADSVVDEDLRQNTSISVMATAGLRLLPDEQSNAIINMLEI